MSATSTVVGNITHEPDLQYGQSGKARTTFSIAVNHSRKNRQTDQWEQTGTTFYRVTLWEHQAESAAEHLRKGQRVIAFGRIETRTFQRQDGTEGTSLELNVTEIGPALNKYPPKDQQSQPGGFGSGQQPQPDAWSQPQPAQDGWGTPQNSQPAAWDDGGNEPPF